MRYELPGYDGEWVEVWDYDKDVHVIVKDDKGVIKAAHKGEFLIFRKEPETQEPTQEEKLVPALLAINNGGSEGDVRDFVKLLLETFALRTKE